MKGLYEIFKTVKLLTDRACIRRCYFTTENEQITKEDYDDLEEKDADKVYFVYDTKGRVKQYIGEAELGGTSVTAGSIIPNIKSHMNMVTGTITEVQ